MISASLFRKYLVRLLIVSLISVVMVLILNEVAFLLQKDRSISRSPGVVTLVIPAGVAVKLENGQTDTGIPKNMTFVVGDILEVRNEDDVTHQLGPLYIPPGTTASMPLNEVNHFTLGCSFQSGNYMGVDVREPTTFGTRLAAMFTAGPTTAALLFIASLVFYPITDTKKEKKLTREV